MTEGDPEANYAYYALHKFRWKPSEFLAMDPYEQAFVIAAIDVRVEKEKQEAAAAKRKAKRR
ncbi:MAG: hypothetical protein IJA41_09740 [Clostridia bacterium]|nr:hypothetical protein [Clostridia bacterium]